MRFLRSVRLGGGLGAAAAAVVVLAGATLSPAGAALVSDSPARTPTFNGPVYAVAFGTGTGTGTVYVGGAFTAAIVGGRTIARQRLAAFDAGTGALLDWRPSADASVRAIAADGEDVYVAGDFGRIGGFDRGGLAKLTRGRVAPIRHDIAGVPRTLGIGHGRLYVGGRFTEVDGRPRGNLAAFSLATGELDGGWAAGTDGAVEAVTVTADRIYLAGVFKKTNAVSSSGKLTAVHPGTGALDRRFLPRPPVVVHGIAVDHAGTVYGALGGQGGRVVAFGPDGTTRWTATFDGDAQAVAVLDGNVYVGGHFDNLCLSDATGTRGGCADGAVTRVKHAAFTADGQPTSWAPNANGIAGTLAVAASATLGVLVTAGEFTTINARAQKRLALFDL